MNTQITMDQLSQLKLNGMSNAYQAMLSMPVQDQPSLNQFMARLVEAETQDRAQKKTEMFLLQSKLRYNAVLEQVHCNTNRNLDREKLMMIADCSFIDRGENLLVTGSTGCGKSFLSCAIGRQACIFGYRTMYFGMNRFLERISSSKLEGTYVKLLNQLEKTHLIILDDFGLQPLDSFTRLALLQILEDRYGKKSVIISSQLPVSKWHEFIGSPTIADSILDRLSVNAHRFELAGQSLRKKN
jgi:DNA replication protein DnaC